MSTPHHHHSFFFGALAILYFFMNSVPTISAESWDVFQNFTNCRIGQTRNGLSIVKNYFHRFGYIANTPLNNFTDDFDKTLVFAIRAYQKNYHLNVTGKLDDSTIRLMMQLRCSVPDLIVDKKIKNATTTMTSRNWPGGNHAAHLHMVSHYLFYQGRPRWPIEFEQLTYAFSTFIRYEFKRAIERAFSHWAHVLKIQFLEVSSYETAHIKIAFRSYDGAGGLLGRAFPPTDGHIHLDDGEFWVVLGDVSQSTNPKAMDLESVAMHEIEHALGLRHSKVYKAVMYPTIPFRKRKVNLAGDDIKGIKVLYGIE